MTTVREIRDRLRQAGRVVVKVGTRLVTAADGQLDQRFIDELAGQIAAVRARGVDVVLVTSGAVHLGRRMLPATRARESVSLRQAMAALGQPELMRGYISAFSRHGILAAQLLLTADDTIHRERYLNARNTLETLLRQGAVPVINENDSVSIEGVTATFGENDRLAALVAIKVRADAVIFLSDQPGLLTADPRTDPDAGLIPVVGPDDDLCELAGSAGGPESAGGMARKTKAAQLAASCGIIAVIADGRERDVLPRVLAGESIGTLFLPRPALEARKAWLAAAAEPAGEIIIDAGAVRALLERDGASLLPVGIKGVMGDFSRGDLVIIRGPGGQEVARGLVNYDADELRCIMGHHTAEIEALLGRRGDEEAVHRDHMVVTAHDNSSR